MQECLPEVCLILPTTGLAPLRLAVETDPAELRFEDRGRSSLEWGEGGGVCLRTCKFCTGERHDLQESPGPAQSCAFQSSSL